MSTLDMEFTRRFSMGHRLLSDAAPRCAIPHGHNEYVTVAIRQKTPTRLDGHRNMIANFGDVKRRWHKFVDESLDHGLQLGEDDPLLTWFETHEPANHARIIVTPGDPTTELMAALLIAKISTFLSTDHPSLECFRLTLRETETNTVTLTGRAEDFVPSLTRSQARCWWWRNDNSVSNIAFK